MDAISISQLKAAPAKVISKSQDYPVAVESRNRISAYLVGKNLFEKIIRMLEDYEDKKAVENTDFTRGEDFEDVAKELGL
jgi:PHD/YefM family antitoxin component YafN of YafNO toxin-antitoxin module